MTLTDEEIDAIWPGSAPTLEKYQIVKLVAAAREANRLRAALKEALDGWQALTSESGDPEPYVLDARIAALRKLLDGAG